MFKIRLLCYLCLCACLATRQGSKRTPDDQRTYFKKKNYQHSSLVWQLCFIMFCCIACDSPDAPPPPPPVENTYLFLGHSYNWRTENRIDPRLELLDFSDYKGVWLGGDVCARTSKDEATLRYLDSLFDLKSKTTHWSWGNHDLMEGDEERLRKATEREDYYTENLDGLQMIVLNTNLFWHYEWRPAQEECERKQTQVNWLHQVLDTIEAATHVVVLHHHGLLNEYKDTTANWGNLETSPVRLNCDATSDFTASFYPKLVKIHEKGIPVIMISGDVGMLRKCYALTTPEGIDVLGSGINNSLNMAFAPDYVTNFNPDSVLILHHQPAKQQLAWSFVRLSDIVKQQLTDDEYQALTPEMQKLLIEY